jgi:hypothetical protein
MSKRKEGIKELRLIGAAMADLEVANELGQDKGSQVQQAVPSLMNQIQQSSSNVSQQQVAQQTQMQRAQLFEQLAQQAKEGAEKARNFNNLT